MIPFYENTSNNLRAFRTQNFVFPLHLHSQLEILYVLDGCVEVTAHHSTRLLQKGDCAILFPNVIHSYDSASTHEVFTNEVLTAICDLNLTGNYLSSLTKFHPEDPFLSAKQLHPNVLYAFENLMEECQGGQDPAVYHALIQLFLSRVIPALSLVKNKGSDSTGLTYQIAQYISQNFQEHLSLDILAGELCVSKYHLSHVFSGKMGISFHDYVNSIRLNYAAEKIRSTDQPITEICIDAGFDSQRTFHRVFKAVYQKSPLKYRFET